MIWQNHYVDATAVAEAIKNQKLKPEEAVQMAIDMIKTKNNQVNAVTSLRAEEALKEAQDLTDFSQPFAGVPILLKDLGHSMKGLPSTSGSRLLKNNIAQQTANFTQSLIDAGFIVVGQSNVPEFGLKNHTDPELFGPARNPVNLSHSPGGSSGGSAAAIQSGMVPIASASDGGGSIRIPASFSGLIGLKPSRGRTAMGPGTWRGWGGASVNFALTQSIRDTRILLQHLQVEQMANPFAIRKISNEDFFLAEQNVKKLRIAYSTKSPVGGPVSRDAIAAVEMTVKFLTENGFNVSEATPKTDGIKLMEAYYLMNGAEQANSFSYIEARLGRSIQKAEVEMQSWVLAQYGKHILGSDYIAALTKWDQGAEKMMRFHHDFDILVQPATADTAPKIGQKFQSDDLLSKMSHAEELTGNELKQVVWDMFAGTLDITPFSQQANLTGQPAISLPLHTAENGLPVGVQLLAPKGREDWLLALSKYIEDAGKFHSYHRFQQ